MVKLTQLNTGLVHLGLISFMKYESKKLYEHPFYASHT